MKKIRTIAFVIVSSLLFGCNGSDGGEGTIQDDFYYNVENSFHHTILSNDKSKHIDLSDNIHMQGNGSVSIKNVSILSGDCSVPIIDDLSLVVTDNKSNLCTVNVEYLSDNNIQKFSDVTYIVSAGEQGDILPILNLDKSLEQSNTPFVIDLKSSLGSDYPFDYHLVSSSVVGNGQVDNDTTNDTLSFSTDIIGSTRIYYSLASENPENKPVYGYINTNITSDDVIPPQANDIALVKDVVAGESITVNLNDLDAIKEGTVPLSEVQVTDVYMLDTYNAASVKIDNQDDLRNVEFSFQSQYQGKYYVSDYISDHLGNSDIGIVEINVKPAYDLIFLPNVGIFTAPLTAYDVLDTKYERVDPSYIYTENGSNGPNGLDIALFSQADANQYCSDIGMTLATRFQLEQLDKSVSESTLFGRYNWPQSHLFWGLENNGAFDFQTHEWIEEKPATTGYFTCVMQVESDQVTIHSKDKLYVGQKDDAYLTTKLNSGEEIVIPDEYVNYSVDNDNILSIDVNNGDITALKFGLTNITGTLIDSSVSDSKQVEVIEQPKIEMKVKAYVMVGETTPVTFEISYDGGKSWQPLPEEIIVQSISMEPTDLATISNDGVNQFKLTGDKVGDVLLTAHTNHPEIDKYIEPRTVLITDSDVCFQYAYFDRVHDSKYCLVYNVDEFIRIPGLKELIADDRGIINNNPYVYPNDQNKFCRLIGADEYLIPKDYGISRYIGGWISGWTDENSLTSRLVKERFEGHEAKPGRRMYYRITIPGHWKGWYTYKNDVVAPTCMYTDIHVNPSKSTKKRFENYKQMVRNVVLIQ
ncbi:hypothetical protein [uncultured Photobacterium sp.]|uniref:hypothetical protein n=1 Tax=uncultured Photobacterium sp. TaxID=173973 RepID=UPI00261DE597|nr:hypothetical protein [uncultured Photobacterium sp.]